ncbi:hypothetical protein GCK72_000542 [Caenorhabditis remanei]|uniref:Uncharacterized protein n=1 Tax=Caenorhabditis remanei TaxID=31234 RepID=A0A6A5HMB5_CAERE|nr:hypothetical protein GCK72_000542 [Caenorhabditis remanei]KAF1768729.1 hypothetical protein GCK72_000542 [Caenorhabditis remanei]
MLLLLLLLHILLTSADPDKFRFDVSFQCKYPPSYHYKVQFVEWDWWLFNSDDAITQEQRGVAPSGTFNFTMSGFLNGDELTSEGYDVRMKLSHNCTQNHEDVDSYMTIKPLCKIGEGLCYFRISKDISDAKGDIRVYGNLVDYNYNVL